MLCSIHEYCSIDLSGLGANRSDVVQEVVDEVNSIVIDEICSNDEYFSKLENTVKTKCSIQLVPVNQSDIESFRDSVEQYFNQRKDIIESVVHCKVENDGRCVRLESVVRRTLWINFSMILEKTMGICLESRKLA